MKHIWKVIWFVVCALLIMRLFLHYDIEKDPSFHQHTQKCAQQGCQFIDE